MRTTAGIIEHYREAKDQDFLGFQAEVLLPYLSADEVRPFCKPDTDLSDWEAEPLTELDVLAEMRKYMEFAWEKVENHRGISASRSVTKMEAWLWVLGRDDLLKIVAAAGHQNYGAPKLKVICEALTFPVPDGDTVNRMAEGKPCRSDCDEGCGS